MHLSFGNNVLVSTDSNLKLDLDKHERIDVCVGINIVSIYFDSERKIWTVSSNPNIAKHTIDSNDPVYSTTFVSSVK